MSEQPSGREREAATRRPNHYRNGRNFEWRIRDVLQDAGYEVSRTAGSKTKVDLFAARPGLRILVQCKRSGALPPAEWNALIDLAALWDAVPVLARGGRGDKFWQLTARKSGRGGKQPMTVIAI